MSRRVWDGKAVTLDPGGLGSLLTNKPVEIRMTEEGARRLSFALASVAAVRKAQGREQLLLPEVQELLDAINYVFVADPASVAAHKAMEAGKGMTPDGGYRAPDHSPGACVVLRGAWCGRRACQDAASNDDSK